MILLILFKGRLGDRTALATFTREATVVNNFKTNLLLGIDYLVPEKFDINLLKGYVLIESY